MTIFHTFKTSITSESKSTRRPEALTDADCDHEIQLHDNSSPTSRAPSSELDDLTPTPSPSSRTPLKKSTLRKELAHRSLSRYRSSQNSNASTKPADRTTPLITTTEAPAVDEDSDLPPESPGSVGSDEESRGRPRKSRSYGATKLQKKDRHDAESHIDILYENQRGCFCCGLPFFSSAALGNLDTAPWTNEFHKPSPTNIANAQVPDPSWKWAWKEWKTNHNGKVDENGFEYSFSFSKVFSWHGPAWWNSYVRRRAWIRKRVKKQTIIHVQESHMLNADYFTIHPPRNRSRNSRTSSQTGGARFSVTALAKQEMEEELEKEDIANIVQLIEVLKRCRIDREKMEAVENFIQHGGEDLYYLGEKMHEIMAQFIFQVSRRLLLAHLLQISDEAIEHRKKHEERGEKEREDEKRRIDNLQAAIKHAEEEVERLEFWSDVKDMAEKGESLGAADDARWCGVDNSGPKDVISERNREKGKENVSNDAKSKGSWMSGVSGWSKKFLTQPPSPLTSPSSPGNDTSTSSSIEKGKGKEKATD